MLKLASSSFATLLIFLLAPNASGIAPFSVENVSLEYQKSERTNELTLFEYNTKKKPVVVFPADFAGKNCVFDQKTPCPAGARITIDQDQRKKSRAIEVRYESKGQMVHFVLRTLPENFPEYFVEGNSGLEKDIFISAPEDVPGGRGHFLILSPSGELRFYRQVFHGAMDFRQQYVEGKNSTRIFSS